MAKKEVERKKKTEITVQPNKKGLHKIKMLTILRIFALPIFRLIKPFRVYGQKKVADGACIYISNHYSMVDPAYPISTTKEGIHFVSKKEAFEMPVIGWVLHKAKAIKANRDGNDVRALLDCFKCLKNGEKICIYPEGTRNKTGVELGEFEAGSAAIAIKSKVPIIPIMIYQKPRYFRTAHVLIGEPLEFPEYYGKKVTEEDYAEVNEKLRQIMLNMRKEHTEYLASKKAKGQKKV